MPGNSEYSTQIQLCIDRLQAGDDAARDELVRCAAGRLARLARTMLRDHPAVRRYEDSDDVFQSGVLRLWNALKETRPKTVAEFFRLAALIIRRELIDLARRHFGPEGSGAHHTSMPPNNGASSLQAGLTPVDTTHEPRQLAGWTEFHERIGALPEEERALFDLLWYHGLSLVEAAGLLQVSERTVHRRWQAARLKIFEAFQGDLPA